MSNGKPSSECQKSRVIELGITRRFNDGRTVTLCLANKSEKPRFRQSSGSHVSSRSIHSTGMTRFEAAREAARAWNSRKESSRRGHFSPASEQSAHSTRSAPALLRRKFLSPLRLNRKDSCRTGPRTAWPEEHDQTTSSTVSDSDSSSSSSSNRTLSPPHKSKPRRDRSSRQTSHTRNHVGYHQDPSGTRGSSTVVDKETSEPASAKSTEQVKGTEISPPRPTGNVTETSQGLDTQDKSTTTHSKLVPNTPHAAFPGFMQQQQQPQYYHHVGAFAAQHAATGPGTTHGVIQPSCNETMNGYHVYYVPQAFPYQVPLFSPSAVIPQPLGSNQLANPQVQTITASQAAQAAAAAAAFTLASGANNEQGKPRDGSRGAQSLQLQAPQVAVYTAASSGASTTTPLVSPTYSVDTSQASGLGDVSTATSDNTITTGPEGRPKSRGTRDGEFGRISLDSEAVPRLDGMRSGASMDSKAVGHLHGRLLGPLSKHYFCFGCGRVRSKRFHRQNPLKENRDPDTNYCANCRREHAKDAAQHSISSLSSTYPEIVMPESSSIGSTSHVSQFGRYSSLRQGLAELLPDTPTRKSTSGKEGNLLCDSSPLSRPLSSRGRPSARLITPPRQTLTDPRGVEADCDVRSAAHNHVYRPPSVESVIDSSLEQASDKKLNHRSCSASTIVEPLLQTPRREQSRQEIRRRPGKNIGVATTRAGPDMCNETHPSCKPARASFISEPKQVRFDQRLDEWFSQSSSQAHVDGSDYGHDLPAQDDQENVESHQDIFNGAKIHSGSPRILEESPCVKVLDDETSDRERENKDDDGDEDEDDDPFAIPARSHKPRLFPITTRPVADDSIVSARQESTSPTPVPRFRSASDRGSPMRKFSEKLAAMRKHEPVPLQPQSPFVSCHPLGKETYIMGPHCGREQDLIHQDHPEVHVPTTTTRPRHTAPAPVSSASAFQFHFRGPHNYYSLAPAPASAPPTRKSFDFSSLADDPRDESDPFYSHSLSDWELEQRFQELHRDDSWNGCNSQEDLGGFAQYGPTCSDLAEEDLECVYGPLIPDDGYFSME